MAELVDHCAIAAEFLMNSIDADSRNIIITIDLLLNKIICIDDGKGIENISKIFQQCNISTDSGVYKRHKSHLRRMITIANIDIVSKSSLMRIERKTIGDKQFIDHSFDTGTTIVLTKIFNNNQLRIKEFIDPKVKIALINRFKRFLCTISLDFPGISFRFIGSCNNLVIDLPRVNDLEKRFMQITGVKPCILPDRKITSLVDLSIKSFEPFIINGYPANRALIGYEEIKSSDKYITVTEGKIIDYIWDREGLTIMLEKEEEFLTDSETINVGEDVIRNLQYISIWNRKFILATYDNILYAVDQHAAHERVNLSKLMKLAFVERHPKMLMRPMEIHKSFMLPMNKRSDEALKKWGWRINGLQVVAVPCVCGVVIDEMTGMINFAIQASTGNEPEIPDCILDALRTRACKTAIKFGDFIDDTRARALLADLANSDRPNHCAHGRTVVAPILDFNRPLSKFEGI